MKLTKYRNDESPIAVYQIECRYEGEFMHETMTVHTTIDDCTSRHEIATQIWRMRRKVRRLMGDGLDWPIEVEVNPI